ncbi:putative membrane protein [Candidatus Protochlamydia naegleriophila]|uniref:Putative membrane protein n=1 Tax=Candidatus Protochlamydia naegleriophila TaxID=389348 RepID=A0A0U5JFL5_9BACT|nr:hypothetical protein [Candidatus Protochlamydia naegleriophila]CUI17917.1 putative membrane protein [Candidatus Protochlamydia naegleriophila]
MNMRVNFPSFNACLQALPQVPQSVSDFLSSEHVRRVKEVALSIFRQIYNFFSNYNSESTQSGGSVKSIGMIGFMSLIAIMLITLLRTPRNGNREQNRAGFLPPVTPGRG